jgi:hypothetical protein
MARVTIAAFVILSRLRLIDPKHRIHAYFAYHRNQTAPIVANQLGENFIPHGQFALAAHLIAELAHNHTERRLDIRAIVIAGQKFVAVKHDVAEHPQNRSGGGAPIREQQSVSVEFAADRAEECGF